MTENLTLYSKSKKHIHLKHNTLHKTENFTIFPHTNSFLRKYTILRAFRYRGFNILGSQNVNIIHNSQNKPTTDTTVAPNYATHTGARYPQAYRRQEEPVQNVIFFTVFFDKKATGRHFPKKLSTISSLLINLFILLRALKVLCQISRVSDTKPTTENGKNPAKHI